MRYLLVMRVPAEDRRQIETTIGGATYRARDGHFDMPEPAARLHMKSAGYGASWPVAPMPAPSHGYDCPAGHGSWFRVCGRHGLECTKTTT